MTDSKDKAAKEGSDSEEISLEQLSNAFAEMMGDGVEADADASAGQAGDAAEDAGDEAARDNVDDDAVCPITPKSVLEAMLFVGHPENQPLGREHAASLIRGVDETEVDQLVQELNDQFGEAGRPYKVVSEGAGYRMVLRERFGRVREKFYGRVRESRLSQAAVEILSLVAYNQPMTSEKLSIMRGHPSGTILSQLVRRKLLRMERPEEKPRTPVYYTTTRFLELFGLDSIDDLPRSQ